MENPIRLGIVGCGHLAGIVAKALKDGLLPEYNLVGATSRTFTDTQSFTSLYGGKACASLQALLARHPDYVIETASPDCVRTIAEPVLTSGANLVVLSIGAFADEAFYSHIIQVAREHNRKVHIASGAIGGFDVLRTTALMGSVTAGITTRKGPLSLKNTPLFQEDLMGQRQEREVFRGTADEAISLLPTKVNVAVAASLATAGPRHTNVSIRSVSGMAGDDHRIEVSGKEVRAVVDVYSQTSDIAGWSIVALLQNLVSPIVF